MTNVRIFASPAAEYAEVYNLITKYDEIGDHQAVSILRFRLHCLAEELAPKIIRPTLLRFSSTLTEMPKFVRSAKLARKRSLPALVRGSRR